MGCMVGAAESHDFEAEGWGLAYVQALGPKRFARTSTLNSVFSSERILGVVKSTIKLMYSLMSIYPE